MKKPILQKQTLKKLKSDYKIARRLYVAIATIILFSIAYSAYRILNHSGESFTLLPFALIPILVVIGLKALSIKKSIYRYKDDEIHESK